MKNFNWAVLIGSVIISVALFVAISEGARRIAFRLPGAGVCRCEHKQFFQPLPPGEFMLEGHARSFLSMDRQIFNELLQAGELSGTYAVFPQERRRRVYHSTFTLDPDVLVVPDDMVFGEVLPGAAQESETTFEYQTYTHYHRVFSREKLTEWLNNRITGG
jgi:hypothetical protein